MGVKITKNSKGLYRLISTVSDESLHPEKKYITEKEARKVLIERQVWENIREIIKIAENFPTGYSINGKPGSREKGLELVLKLWKQDDPGKAFVQKYNEIMRENDLNELIIPEL